MANNDQSSSSTNNLISQSYNPSAVPHQNNIHPPPLRLSHSYHHRLSFLIHHNDNRSSSCYLHQPTLLDYSNVLIEDDQGQAVLHPNTISHSPPLTLVNNANNCSASILLVRPKTHHHSPYVRAWLLLFLALSVTGSFWAFDLPAQLNIALGQRFGYSPDAWQAPFSQLYSTYALPNVVMPFVAGRLVDVYGPRTIHLCLLVIVCLGQLLVTTGIYLVSYPWLILGRFLLGVGGESLSVAQARITCDWFSHSELGFALGFQLAFARLGSVLNDLFTARIEANLGASVSSMIALSVCMTSMLFGCLACLIDRQSQSTQYTQLDQDPPPISPEQHATHSGSSDPIDPGMLNGNQRSAPIHIVRPRVPSINPSSYLSLGFDGGLNGMYQHVDDDYEAYQHHFTPAHDAFVMGYASRPSLSAAPSLLNVAGVVIQQQPFVLLTYPSTFWALTIAMVSLYVTCNTFSSISSDFLQFKYDLNATQAGQALALMDIFATMVVPISGLMFERVSRTGQRLIVIVNAMGLACVFIGLAVSPKVIYLYIGMALVGTAYAVGASMLWPLIPVLIHDPGSLSTAYGVVTCGVNGMLSILPAFFAALIAKDPSFRDTLFAFAGMAGIGALAAFMT